MARSSISQLLMPDTNVLPILIKKPKGRRRPLDLDVHDALHKRYKHVRMLVGWTDQEIGTVLDYSSGTVGHWGNAGRHPPVGALAALEAIAKDWSWMLEISAALLKARVGGGKGGKKRRLVPGRLLGPKGGGRRKVEAEIRKGVRDGRAGLAGGWAEHGEAVVMRRPRGRPRKSPAG